MKKLTILILLAMAVVCRASAQNRVVTGTVSEEDGTPLTGAVVQVVGTNNAATAAIDGLYTLKNVPSGAVLRVSFLGYDPVEKKVDAATPPTLLFHCDDDKVVPAVNSALFYQKLKEHGIKATLHIYPSGGHGWGMNSRFRYYDDWQKATLDWLSTL